MSKTETDERERDASVEHREGSVKAVKYQTVLQVSENPSNVENDEKGIDAETSLTCRRTGTAKERGIEQAWWGHCFQGKTKR